MSQDAGLAVRRSLPCCRHLPPHPHGLRGVGLGSGREPALLGTGERRVCRGREVSDSPGAEGEGAVEWAMEGELLATFCVTQVLRR